MGKNKLFNLLFLTILVFTMSFFGADSVNADSIKIKSVNKYNGTVARRRVTTSGLEAYGLEMAVEGPGKGISLQYSEAYVKGMYVYIVNDTKIASGRNKKSFLTKQHAIWLCQGRTPGSNYKTRVTKKYPYYTEANKLCAAAKKAGDNFTIDPTISINYSNVKIPETITSVISDKKRVIVKVDKTGSYVSSDFVVSTKDISGNKYKVAYTNAPEGTKIYAKSGKDEKELKSMPTKFNTRETDFTNAKAFVIKVPSDKIVSTTSFSVEVTANTSSHKMVKRYSSKDYQDMAVSYTASETPKVAFNVSLVPDIITIKELDADSGEALNGAKYRIFTNSNCTGDVTNFTDTYTTDTYGFIRLYNIVAGTYYVKEITPPAGYNPASTICQKVVTNTAVTFKNKKIGVVVKKVDSDTNEPLSGAKYSIYTDDECKKAVAYTGTKSTNFDGLAYFYGIPNGTYYVKELEPPVGYLNTGSNCLRVESNNTIVFKSKRKVKIKIKKIDADTKEALKDAKYRLFSDSYCEEPVTGFTNEVTTDKDGWAYYDDVPNGTYYVKEIAAPSDYVLPVNNCLKVNKNNEVTFENRRNIVRVYVQDADNSQKFLAGATYQIFSGEGCSKTISDLIAPKATNEKGVVEFIGLPTGDVFSVKEIETPAGYDKSTTSCQTVKKNSAVTFRNKMNSITVVSKDASSGVTIGGAVFGIYSDSSCKSLAKSSLDGDEYSKEVASNTGKVVFSGMKNSTYYIKEETPPSGYYAAESSNSCKPVEVNSTVVFESSKSNDSDVIVQKRDAFTHFGIDGVKIGLYSDFACSNQIQEAITANGQAVFHVSAPDDGGLSYFVKENDVPKGYISSNVECKSVRNGETVIINNTPYGDIKVLEIEEGTDKPIKGITYRLLTSDKKTVVDIDGKEVTNVTTGADGVALFKNIKYGVYFIQEVKSNPKYKVLNAPIRFVLNENTDAKKIQKDVDVNYRLGDTNDDTKVNSDDLTIYQNIISGKKDILELSPKTRYSIDVNKDSNDSVAGLTNDMKIVQYYVTFANKKDRNILSDARRYNKRKTNLCSVIGNKECNIDNVEYIYQMDKEIKATNTEYLLARNQTELKENKDVNISDTEYAKMKQEYEKACPAAENTMGTNGKLKVECQVIPEVNMTPMSDVCARFTEHIPGDINGDCEVTKEDVVKFEEMIKNKKASSIVNADLNHDKKVDYSDLNILDEYVSYSLNNHNKIMNAIKSFVNSKNELCESDVKGCNVDEDMLELALTKVGKLMVMPKEIASASMIVSSKKITIKVSKQSITNYKELPGARILIKDSNGKTVYSFISDSRVKEFEILAGKYTLTETVSPRGYKSLQSPLKFEVQKNGAIKYLGSASILFKIDNLNHIVVYNEVDAQQQEILVPDTASDRGKAGTIIGSSLILGGICMLFISKRKTVKEIA